MGCFRRQLRLLAIVALCTSSLVMMIDTAAALSHHKSTEYGGSSSVEGLSMSAERCGCMIGPAGPPGIPGVPGK